MDTSMKIGIVGAGNVGCACAMAATIRGKFHEMPCHHTLEGYLTEYITRARSGEVTRVPLFQAIKFVCCT